MKKTLIISLSLLITSCLYAQKTVVIGTQTWTAENLNVTKFRNGDKIPQAKSKKEWDAFAQAKEPAWCYYAFENGSSKFYNWYAVNDQRILAPKGFHIPTKIEWEHLFEYLGGEEIALQKIKSDVGWFNELNGTNSSGFCAIPSEDDRFASFWSSTVSTEINAIVQKVYKICISCVGLSICESEINNLEFFGNTMSCVRLIKD